MRTNKTLAAIAALAVIGAAQPVFAAASPAGAKPTSSATTAKARHRSLQHRKAMRVVKDAKATPHKK